MTPARRIDVTHEQALEAEALRRADDRMRLRREQRAIEREVRAAHERAKPEILAKVPSNFRGVFTYDIDGNLRETFSCGCDKPSHGHNPYAGIKGPVELTFVPPEVIAREEAGRALAERVKRARPQTPPAARSVPTGGVQGGGRTITGRQRR